MSSDSTVTSASENTDNADKEEKSESGEASGTTTDSEGTETTAESYPAVSLNTKTDGGTEISISTPEGAFPSGIQVSVTKVDSEQILSALKEASDNTDLTADQVVAYDFDFYLNNGEHNIEPQKEISVQFSMPQLKKDDSVTAYHLKDENSVAEKEDVTADVSAGTATLESGKFSIHALLLSAAGNASGITIDYDDQTEIHSVSGQDGTKIILYCMNNDLHWPHKTPSILNVPTYTETSLEEFLDANKPTEEAPETLKTKLENLLYAGYPYNGYSLYKIVDSVPTISEDDFNQLLTPPQYLRDDFPESLGNNTFTYADRNDSSKMSLLKQFLDDASDKYFRGGTTASGLNYQQLTQLPFWKAAYCMVYFSGDPIQSYSSIYVAGYYVTESQSYAATRDAIWTVLYKAGLPKNSKDASDKTLVANLLKADTKNLIPTKPPVEDKVSVSGDLKFSYSTHDGKWHTGALSLTAPSTYHAPFILNLPGNVTEETGKTQVMSGESFSLVSSTKPDASTSISLSATIPWMDYPNLKVYVADSSVTASDGKGFQNMIGAVIHETPIFKTVDLSSSDTSFTFTKVWKDNSNSDNVRPDQDSYKSKLHLMNGTTELTGFTPDITDNGNSTWTITYKDLPQIIDGKDASFTVREDTVDKYSADKATVKNKESITNTYSPVTISGTKTWNDSGYSDVKKPDSITVNLLANGNLVASKSVTAATSWKYSFDNLPKYDDNGQEIVYTITENNVTDYSTTVNGYDITNTYTPGKTSVTVKKEWEDSNNQDGKRPDSVKVQFLSNGNKQGEPVTLSNENGWTYTWYELDEKDKESKE
ncbi:MAG: Cna B-type domain-containing protein, partial [Lachnospiraceae bacterium]|nr:Cna B-type domain-containing protein [Lachnospiraceae bacterium]